jgi:hypothetical protein
MTTRNYLAHPANAQELAELTEKLGDLLIELLEATECGTDGANHVVTAYDPFGDDLIHLINKVGMYQHAFRYQAGK